jgi:hypothetical protein
MAPKRRAPPRTAVIDFGDLAGARAASDPGLMVPMFVPFLVRARSGGADDARSLDA